MTSFQKVLQLARPYWFRYLLGGLTILAVDALEMIPPAATAVALDQLAGHTPRGWFPELLATLSGGSILLLAGFVVLTVIVQWFLRYLWRICFIFTREYVASDLRREYYQKLLRLPLSFYSKARTGHLVSLASNDVDAVRMMMGPAALFLADALAYFLFVGVLLASWHLTMTLYLFALVPFLVYLVRRLSLEVQNRFAKVQENLGELTACAQEAFAGIQVIRNFSREGKMEHRFSQRADELYQSQVHLAKVQSALWPTMSFFVGLEALLVLFVGGGAVKRGELTPGEFVGFFLSLWLLTWPTVALGWAIGMYQRGIASLRRICEILEKEEEREEGKLALPKGGIVFQKVSFRYSQKLPWVLKDISFSIPEGAKVALVGPLGAGKSSLFHLLLKFYQAEKGKILWGGKTLEEISSLSLHRSVGYVPQVGFLFSTTLFENIALGEKVGEKEVIEAAKLACIHEEILSFPEGYETQVGERGVKLSGGQRQRIALARALVKRPAWLFLDDCLNAVDAATEEKILSHLLKLPWESTLLLTTHRLTTLWDMDWIVVIEKGRVVDEGKAEDLAKREGWFRRTLERQMFERKMEV